MKIDFERESTGREHLPPQQRATFFERMKGVVVLIETEFKPRMPEPEPSVKRDKFGKPKWRKLSDSDETKKPGGRGTGFFFNSNGLILTAAHVVPENRGAVRFWVEDDDCDDIEDATDAEVVSANYQLDLAILKPKKNYTSNFATFREDTLNIGTEVFLIGHPRDLYFSCLVGEIAASERLYRDIYRSQADLLDLNGDLRVVQINNLHALGGASGGPVFDSSGKVVGVVAFGMEGYEFAIHFSTLKQFCGQFSESHHPGSQKRKDKKFLKEERRREKAKRHWRRKKK